MGRKSAPLTHLFAMADAHKIALLIDADNTQRSKLDGIIAELSRRGTLCIRRAYGNWSKPHLGNWQKPLGRHGFKAEQQFDYAIDKNATDMALTIDAMDLLYSSPCDTFAIVSSDSDFTPLAIRLREGGKNVIGFGREQTPAAFRNSCAEFICIDAPGAGDDEVAPEAAATAAVEPGQAAAAALKPKDMPHPKKKEVHAQLRYLSSQHQKDGGYVTTMEANAHLRTYFKEHGKNYTLASLGFDSYEKFFKNKENKDLYEWKKVDGKASYRCRPAAKTNA